MRETVDGFQDGLQIGGRMITNLRYADDIILLATSEAEFCLLFLYFTRVVTTNKLSCPVDFRLATLRTKRNVISIYRIFQHRHFPFCRKFKPTFCILAAFGAHIYNCLKNYFSRIASIFQQQVSTTYSRH